MPSHTKRPCRSSSLLLFPGRATLYAALDVGLRRPQLHPAATIPQGAPAATHHPGGIERGEAERGGQPEKTATLGRPPRLRATLVIPAVATATRSDAADVSSGAATFGASATGTAGKPRGAAGGATRAPTAPTADSGNAGDTRRWQRPYAAGRTPQRVASSKPL